MSKAKVLHARKLFHRRGWTLAELMTRYPGVSQSALYRALTGVTYKDVRMPLPRHVVIVRHGKRRVSQHAIDAVRRYYAPGQRSARAPGKLGLTELAAKLHLPIAVVRNIANALDRSTKVREER